MIQDTLKTQFSNLQKVSGQVQSTIEKQLDKASEEGYRVLSDVAGEKVDSGVRLADIFAKIKANNPSFRRLMLNVDSATYDTRKTMEWNVAMMAAYAKMQAEKAVEKEIAPKLKVYVDQLEEKTRQAAEKAHEMKSRLIN
ncbi:MAG: hypothetical protein CSB48_01005 [Proteobacteria bacterium]|nr:MAG: hypothetical protein CSB48_01005 [Pseudomonadota bacterium]PIE40328.1 MAG: hypothetical protein CSA51_01175 [Gammaproteobacteria bacterium]